MSRYKASMNIDGWGSPTQHPSEIECVVHGVTSGLDTFLTPRGSEPALFPLAA